MTRSPVGVFLCLLGLLSTMGPAGCVGTETGNPSGPGGGGDRNPAVALAEAICETLVYCFGEEALTQEGCEEAIAGSETLGAAFGIQEEPLPDYGQVIERFEDSELTADEEAVEACAAAIRSLACEDPAVLSVDVEAGFGNVEGMIPATQCSTVFSGS